MSVSILGNIAELSLSGLLFRYICRALSPGPLRCLAQTTINQALLVPSELAVPMFLISLHPA